MNMQNEAALVRLKNNRHLLTDQQYKTLRGKIKAGDRAGAMRGLRNILLLQGSNAIKAHKKE